MVYNYRNVMSGFSARLTPSELEALKSKQAFIGSSPCHEAYWL
jgi:hypothetical protein